VEPARQCDPDVKQTGRIRGSAGRWTPRATSALNVIQRLGGAVGTALFAIVLSRQAGTGAGGAGAGGAGPLAGAFGTTFWVAAGLVAVAVVPALLLPRARHQT